MNTTKFNLSVVSRLAKVTSNDIGNEKNLAKVLRAVARLVVDNGIEHVTIANVDNCAMFVSFHHCDNITLTNMVNAFPYFILHSHVVGKLNYEVDTLQAQLTKCNDDAVDTLDKALGLIDTLDAKIEKLTNELASLKATKGKVKNA